MDLKKVFHTFIVFILLFVVCMPVYGQQEFYIFEENARNFITNVLTLALSNYEVVFSDKSTSPEVLGFPPHIVNLYYVYRGIKSSSKESFHVSIRFTNGILTHCSIDFIEPPLFSEAIPNDVMGSLERARLILSRYWSFFGAEHVKPMLEMLNEVKKLGNYTKIEGKMRFTISCEVDVDTREIGLVHICMNYWENGIEFRRKSIGLLFTSNELTFYDTWNLYRIGSAELNVSEEDAVRIAKKAAKNFTYTAADYEGKTVVVGNFTVLDKPLYVDLSTDYRGTDHYTLYPFWEVYLCLDTMYLGGVTGLRVLIWVDTGEVTGIYPTGGLGAPPNQETTDGNQQESANAQRLPMEQIANLTVVLSVVIATAAVITLKHKKRSLKPL